MAETHLMVRINGSIFDEHKNMIAEETWRPRVQEATDEHDGSENLTSGVLCIAGVREVHVIRGEASPRVNLT